MNVPAQVFMVDGGYIEIHERRKKWERKLGPLVNFGHYPKIEHERFIDESLLRFLRS